MTRCITCDCRLGDGWCHACAAEANKGAKSMSEIEITDDLLDEIEAKAKAAQKVAPGPWEVDTEEQTDAPYKHDEFALLDANGKRFAGTENSDTLWGLLEQDTPDEDGYCSMWNEPARVVTEFIQFCDPLTTLALVAEVRWLREQLKIADEQAAALEGVASSATRWDGAKYSSLELAARRQALEEAARHHDKEIAATEQQIQENKEYLRREGLGDNHEVNDYCEHAILVHRLAAAKIRDLKDKEPGQ